MACSVGRDRQIKLMDKGQSGQTKVHAAGFLQGNPHVLDEVLYIKTRIEVSLQDARCQIGQRPATGRSSRDAGKDLVEIEPGLKPVQERFAHADHRAGDNDLVAHLGMLPGPRRPLMDDLTAHNIK